MLQRGTSFASEQADYTHKQWKRSVQALRVYASHSCNLSFRVQRAVLISRYYAFIGCADWDRQRIGSYARLLLGTLHPVEKWQLLCVALSWPSSSAGSASAVPQQQKSEFSRLALA